MSIKCKSCNYEMSTFEFFGHLTAELFDILKGRLTRNISLNWDKFMAGFANEHKITCPMCEKHVAWFAEVFADEYSAKLNKQKKQQKVLQ